MAQYNTLNVKFGKLKSGIINSTEETLNFSDFCKAFANGLSANFKFWKTNYQIWCSQKDFLDLQTILWN